MDCFAMAKKSEYYLFIIFQTSCKKNYVLNLVKFHIQEVSVWLFFLNFISGFFFFVYVLFSFSFVLFWLFGTFCWFFWEGVGV